MRTETIDKLPPSHEHSYGTDWKSDADGHWHECECGDKIDSAAHTEDGGTVTKAPTETETGIKTYKCSACGYEMRTENIDKLPSGGGDSGTTSGTTSSGDISEPGKKDPDEQNGNPSTGVATSLIPLAIAAAFIVAAAKRKIK